MDNYKETYEQDKQVLMTDVRIDTYIKEAPDYGISLNTLKNFIQAAEDLGADSVWITEYEYSIEFDFQKKTIESFEEYKNRIIKQ